jgi:hypothetical protein
LRHPSLDIHFLSFIVRLFSAYRVIHPEVLGGLCFHLIKLLIFKTKKKRGLILLNDLEGFEE